MVNIKKKIRDQFLLLNRVINQRKSGSLVSHLSERRKQKHGECGADLFENG